MFRIRNLNLEDLDNIFELSGVQVFINLPHDKEVLKERIKTSLACFKNPHKELEKNFYIFGIEDLDTNKIIGVSMIHAQHGTDSEPHFYLRVGHENKYSTTINTGFVHGTLRLGLDTNGPTEIGGLVLDPNYRGHQEKLGKQISFVRFLYMAIHPERFKETIHSELMPPFDKQGKSPLWEALGRRFMNMDYHEADLLSRNNKEFILSLFPSDNIYQTLLPLEARNAIGKVGKQTEPVKKMLENIGFQYMNEVDPFDGGPHFRAKLTQIKPIKEAIYGVLEFKANLEEAKDYLVSIPNDKFEFLSYKVKALCEKNKIIVDNESILEEYNGNETYAIPLD
jgi:arginine N-succinyltransferase